MYIYIYICIEREREREREMYNERTESEQGLLREATAEVLTREASVLLLLLSLL